MNHDAATPIQCSFARLGPAPWLLLILALFMIGDAGSQVLAKTITVDYTGAAPARAKIAVSASGSIYVLGTPDAHFL